MSSGAVFDGLYKPLLLTKSGQDTSFGITRLAPTRLTATRFGLANANCTGPTRRRLLQHIGMHGQFGLAMTGSTQSHHRSSDCRAYSSENRLGALINPVGLLFLAFS